MLQGGNGNRRIRTARRSDARAGIALLKRRCWYADGDGGDKPPADGDNDGGIPPGNAGDDELVKLRAEKEEWRVERATLRRENQERRAASETADEKIKAADEARLLAAGEHETVIANLRADNESLKVRAEIGDRAIETMAANNQAFIDALPEQRRELVPVELDTHALASWIERNRNSDSLSLPTAPNFDAGAGGGSGSKTNNNSGINLDAEQREMAMKMGMTPEQYAARLPSANKK